MANQVIPSALKKGDTIAFVSPSMRLDDVYPSAIRRARSHIESLGFKVKTFYTTPLSADFREKTLQRCAELHAAFSDPSVRAILCVCGGSTASELLRFLDYDLIAKNPKILIGYSDITHLHYALSTRCNLRTFYGPTAGCEFGEYPSPDPFTSTHFLEILTGNGAGPVPRSRQWTQDPLDFFLTGDASTKTRNMTPTPPHRWLRPGKASGPIMGGCTTKLLGLKGTPFFPSHAGAILLLETPMGEGEASPIPVHRTASLMADLGNGGLWDQVAGLVIGRPFAYTEEMRAEFGRMVLEQCAGTSFPILCDVDVGHTSPMVTIPLGGMVGLDSERDEFVILEEGVR